MLVVIPDTPRLHDKLVIYTKPPFTAGSRARRFFLAEAQGTAAALLI
jgi:hypothetical protein